MAGSKEFTYDNTYKTKSDIDLCITYYDFFRAGKYQLSKDIFFGASVFMSIIFSLSVSRKPVYMLMIIPNIATDIAVIIIAFMLFPSHTIIIGASADLGRLLSTIRYGSRQSERPRHNHSMMAVPSPKTIIRKKERKVSKRVTNICMNILPSLAIYINVLRILDGELKINGLITPVAADISQSAIKPARINKRTKVIIA